ncbi:MAG: HTH domain-containing protein, partial [Pseudomonadota bacterium]
MARKSDRLFRIVTMLQGRRTALTAARIAKQLEVSTRTVYRDIQDLMLSGVPITGEAGTGYMLDRRYH